MADNINLSNKIFLFDQFNQESAKGVVKEIVTMAESGKTDISIYSNSYGGGVSDFYAIADTMDKYRKSHGVKFTTIAVGAAKSCGAFLPIYGDKGHRFIGKNTDFMTHGVQNMAYGNTEHFKKQTALMIKMDTTFSKLVSEQTGITEDEALKLLKKDETFTAKQAVEFGFVDALWEEEDEEMSELSKFIERDMAASADGSEINLKAVGFIQSLSNNGLKAQAKQTKKEDIKMTDKKPEMTLGEATAKLEASAILSSQAEKAHLTALADKDKEIQAEKDKITKFYAEQKEAMIASTCKLTKDEAKIAELKANFERIKALPIADFKALAETWATDLTKGEIETGGVKAIKAHDPANDNMSDEEKMVLEYTAQSNGDEATEAGRRMMGYNANTKGGK